MKYLILALFTITATTIAAQRTVGALEAIGIDADSITVCGKLTDAPFNYEGDVTVSKVTFSDRTVWTIFSATGEVVYKTVTFAYTPEASVGFDLKESGLIWADNIRATHTQFTTTNAFLWEVKANDYGDGTGSLMFAYGKQGDGRFTRLFYLWVQL